MSSKLFTPLDLRGLRLQNRVGVSPMCQYSAVEGSATDWHLMHLGQFSVAGPGLIMVEATAVCPEGRITPGDLGLYSDENERALARVLSFLRAQGPSALGLQLGHAGRKASTHPPFHGGGPLGPGEGAWQTVAPSAIPFDPAWHTPRALAVAELAGLRDLYVEATVRALRLGLDLIELHLAHGYLLHQFLSPLSNRRTDEYGGSLENRMRFPLEVFEAVRASWPSHKPLGVRLSATDWVEDGWQLGDSVALARALRERGCDFVDASSGGIAPGIAIDAGPGYQVHLAAKIRAQAQIATCAVGLIEQAHQAEQIIRSGQADLVFLARGFLDDPRWVWHAAQQLGQSAYYAPQYERARRR